VVDQKAVEAVTASLDGDDVAAVAKQSLTSTAGALLPFSLWLPALPLPSSPPVVYPSRSRALVPMLSPLQT
jgi:hypothetical protein